MNCEKIEETYEDEVKIR